VTDHGGPPLAKPFQRKVSRTRVLVVGLAVAIDIAIVASAFMVSPMVGLIALVAILATISIAAPIVRSRRRTFRQRVRNVAVEPSAAAPPAAAASNLTLGSEFAFDTVIAMAAAIGSADLTEFKRLALTLKREDPSPAHIYAWVLLGQSIIERDHQRPEEHRIAELVSEASLLLRLTGPISDEDAARVLRIIFAAPGGDGRDPIEDFLITVILLGALVADPVKQLPTLRPHVIRVCAKLAAEAPQRLGYLVRSVDSTPDS
jgi:hypothetical protein